MVQKFIGGAIKEPGALRSYVWDTYGRSGFQDNGNIKPVIIKKIASGKCPVCSGKVCVCPTTLTRRRAVLARTLQRLGR